MAFNGFALQITKFSDVYFVRDVCFGLAHWVAIICWFVGVELFAFGCKFHEALPVVAVHGHFIHVGDVGNFCSAMTNRVNFQVIGVAVVAVPVVCGEDIDVFFDNVGGTILDTALTKLAARGRVVICGRISQTGASELYGVKNLGLLIGRRARVEGFIVSDYAAEFDRARSWLAERVKAGEIKQRLHILHGLEQCPEGLAMLFRGANTGKLIVAL